MLGNKEIMAKNILYYMEINRVNSSEVCRALGFKQSTFSNWLHAKIYPRIDKIEKMANYFHITKADLVEDHSNTEIESKTIIDNISNGISRLSPQKPLIERIQKDPIFMEHIALFYRIIEG